MELGAHSRLAARHCQSWDLDGVHTATEVFRYLKPRRFFGRKPIQFEEAQQRVEQGEPVTVQRLLDVYVDDRVRLSRKTDVELTAAGDLEQFAQRFGQEGPPREIYQVQIGDRTGWVDPSEYKQANFLDGDADFLITPEEILAETTPRKLSYDEKELLDFQYHSLTHQIPKQVEEYLDYTEIVDQMKALCEQYPGKVEMSSLGESREGRPIWALRLGQGSKESLITALSHAREWPAGQVALDTAKAKLEQGVPSDSSVWIVPVLNPDGYVASRTQDASLRTNAAQVDNNRNYPVDWRPEGDTAESTRDDKGASDKIGSDTYRGEGPASEPENKAVVELFRQRPGIRGWLDLHTYGQLLIHPESERPEAYKALLDDILPSLEAPFKVHSLSDYGDVSGSSLQFGESQGALTIIAELGQAFHPSGERREKAIKDGVAASLRFLDHMEQN